MASADVVVVGAGLSGLTAAVALADAGARVELIARGHAATHWTAGGLDVAAPSGVATPGEGIVRLAARPGHPYTLIGDDVRPAIGFVREMLAAEGLLYAGDLDEPLRAVPTAIGGTRQVGIVPAAQAGARARWASAERLVVCGPAGYKDFWPKAIAASLARPAVWGAAAGAGDRPGRVDALTVDLPDFAGRHNLTALNIARLFDDAAWRRGALELIARAVERVTGRGPSRIALPAVLGLNDHPAVAADADRILPAPWFEVPLVPPSIPGLRLYDALRAGLRRRGGRMLIGEPVLRIGSDGRRVSSVTASAAVRERVVRIGGLVLATGGIAGGGLIGRADGRLEEPLLGLAVDAPPVDEWLASDPFDPAGHPLEAAGIRIDASLRPLDVQGRVAFDNVAIVGALLAGQRYLSERCGDGVAVTSGHRAAAVLAVSSGEANALGARHGRIDVEVSS